MTTQSSRTVAPQSGALRAVILTALPVEYKAVRTHLVDLREETHPQGTVYERGNFSSPSGTWEVGIVEIGAGNIGAVLETQMAIQHFNPSVVLFVGVAGGLRDVRLGDVVVAEKVYGYESGKAKSRFEPRPNMGIPTFRMTHRARAEARKDDWLRRLGTSIPTPAPRVHIGPIAAGEKVIASTRSGIYKFLRATYGDALAVEMEGYGFLKAIHAHPQVNALIVRGISDLINRKGEADAKGYQEIAARYASAFAYEVLAKLVVDFNLNDQQETSRGILQIEVKGNLQELEQELPYILRKLREIDASLSRSEFPCKSRMAA